MALSALSAEMSRNVIEIYHLKSTNPIDQKIFIIDEGEYATMLLAEEY